MSCPTYYCMKCYWRPVNLMFSSQIEQFSNLGYEAARLAQSVERVTLIMESQGREFEPRIGLGIYFLLDCILLYKPF